MVTPRWPCVIFDLDGTLADTIDLIIACYDHALNSVLGLRADPAVARTWIGRTLTSTFAESWPDRAEELAEAYRAFNRIHTPTMVTAYPGIPELLADLRSGGVVAGIATSKGREVADRTIHYAGIDLPVTVSASETDRHKPNPEPLWLARDLLGMAGRPAVYIGEALVDVQAAQAAGMDGIAVTWGAGEPDALRAASPTAVASTVAELRALLLG